jgi:hypothetical protein
MEALALLQDRIYRSGTHRPRISLGKAYADIGQNARAFEHLIRGNAR